MPLAEPVRDLLAGVPRIKGPGYVFTTSGVAPVKGWARVILRLHAGVAAAAEKERGEPVAIAPFGFHDLRRTAATGMARLAVPVHVVEAALNHKSGSVSGIAAVYNRFDYAQEKRAALEAWAGYVLQLVGEKAAMNVVRLETPR